MYKCCDRSSSTDVKAHVGSQIAAVFKAFITYITHVQCVRWIRADVTFLVSDKFVVVTEGLFIFVRVTIFAFVTTVNFMFVSTETMFAPKHFFTNGANVLFAVCTVNMFVS